MYTIIVIVFIWFQCKFLIYLWNYEKEANSTGYITSHHTVLGDGGTNVNRTVGILLAVIRT